MLSINCIFCPKLLVISDGLILCEDHKEKMCGYFEDGKVSTFGVCDDVHCLTIGYRYPKTVLSKMDLSRSDFKIIKIINASTPIPRSYDEFIKKIDTILTYM
jgi:hypothetical protein